MNSDDGDQIVIPKYENRKVPEEENKKPDQKSAGENFSSPGVKSFSKEDINKFQFSGMTKLKEEHNVGASAIYRSPGTVEAAVPSVPEPALYQKMIANSGNKSKAKK